MMKLNSDAVGHDYCMSTPERLLAEMGRHMEWFLSARLSATFRPSQHDNRRSLSWASGDWATYH